MLSLSKHLIVTVIRHFWLDPKVTKRSRLYVLHSSDWRSSAKIYELASRKKLRQHRFFNAASLVGQLTTQDRGGSFLAYYLLYILNNDEFMEIRHW